MCRPAPMLLGRRGLQVRRKTARLDSFAADKRQIRNPWTSLSTLRATTMMKTINANSNLKWRSASCWAHDNAAANAGAFFRALGVWDKDVDNTATIMLRGEAYRVSHWVQSETLGNHYFFLQKKPALPHKKGPRKRRGPFHFNYVPIRARWTRRSCCLLPASHRLFSCRSERRGAL